ncbi:MAG TPA: nuclease-related domain-containing protein, partial [Acidimicrobiales bacterium]|nr:nuclease-related domain-containing protein [Acidimicrobiales bacterium]
RFAKAHAWRIVFAVVFISVLAGTPAVLLHRYQYWFFFGLALGATAGMLGYWVVVYSGSAHAVMGDIGEQWTQQALHPLRKRGWKIIHRVLLRKTEDIDSVAIGPAGVVVVETKWSSDSWDSRTRRQRLDEAAAAASDNARRLWLVLRSSHPEVSVRAVVALWPSDDAFKPRQIAGVDVMPGLTLRDWLLELPAGQLSPERVDAVWSDLSAHLDARDKAGLDVDRSPPKSAEDLFDDVVQHVGGALTGALVVAWLTSRMWFLGMLAAVPLAATWAAARQVRPLRRVATGALLSTVFVGSLFAALVAIAYLHAWLW